jgi:3-(3-hydroxy-phenyl)propionate hydroxylase
MRGGAIPVGIVGAGPVGLACALRLASLDTESVVLEAEPQLRMQGSRACCIQGDVIDVLDKVGVGEAVAAEGVPWHVGRTYVSGKELFTTEYPRRGGFSPWVNLSQYRTQQIMLERLAGMPYGQVCWGHRIIGVQQDDDTVAVRVSTDEGERTMRFRYLVACDGIRSEVRRLLGVPWTGYRHGDRFLIADIRVALPLAHERHFHYDPPFNPGRQLVMHAQPDDVWRIDWQLGPDADIEAEQRSGELDERIRAVVGDLPYEIKWLSTYRFNQRLVTRMRAGRVFLAGDAAHALPPYGARGMNSGIQDADNLAWKLDLVLRGRATDGLLDTYHDERHAAARENLRVTEHTIKFMVPPNPVRRWARNALLTLAPVVKPLRRRVDSGQMAEPFVYAASPIVDRAGDNPLVGRLAPEGAVSVAGRRTRLRRLLGKEFVALYFAEDGATARRFAEQVLAAPPAVPLRVHLVLPGGMTADDLVPAASVVHDADAALREAYGAEHACWYLVRPDGHIAAGGPGDRGADLTEALRRCAGVPPRPNGGGRR